MTDPKAIAQAMYDGMRAGTDVDEWVDRFTTEDFVEHEAGMESTGRDAPREMFKQTLAAFPDFQAEVHELLQDGDKVVARATFSGTHRGEFMGMPATGNSFSIDVIDILEFRDGKCTAHWGLMDRAAMMEQLGAMAPA